MRDICSAPEKRKLIVICGTTASKKTESAVMAAEILGGGIIGADSMQVYREMNIGTAKPRVDEIRGVPYMMTDIKSVREKYSVADYVNEARVAIDEIVARNLIPIVCGGTGMYIEHLLNGTIFEDETPDYGLRAELESLENSQLYEILSSNDPESAAKIHINNRRRLIRAVEILKLTNKTKSAKDADSKIINGGFDYLMFINTFGDRENLYSRINSRTDKMFCDGLLDEARNLYDKGFAEDIRRLGTIGYIELFDYFQGVTGFFEAVDKIKQNTRRYSKRQLTWFRRYNNAVIFNADGDFEAEVENLVRKSREFFNEI